MQCFVRPSANNIILHHTNQFPCLYVVFLPTDRKPDVLEKYFAPDSLVDFSAACGFTISSPCNGVKATLDAVPEMCFLTVVLPPQTCCCFCRFFCSVLLMRTLVFSSICGKRMRPVPVLPIVPRV